MIFRFGMLLASSLIFFSCKARTADKNPNLGDLKNVTVYNDPEKGIFAVQPWFEAWNKHENEAIVEAFTLITDAIKKKNPNVDLSTPLNAFKTNVDLAGAEANAKKYLEQNVNDFEALGLRFKDFLPTAVVFVLGGRVIDEFKITGAVTGQFELAFTVVPKYVTRYIPGKSTPQSYWVFQVAVGAITYARLQKISETSGKTLASDKTRPWRAGMGLIFNPLKDAGDFTGLLGGIAMSRKGSIGNNFKVFAVAGKAGDFSLKNGLVSLLKPTNAVFIAEYISSPTLYNYFHAYGGLALSSSKLMEMILGSDSLQGKVYENGKQTGETGMKIAETAVPTKTPAPTDKPQTPEDPDSEAPPATDAGNEN